MHGCWLARVSSWAWKSDADERSTRCRVGLRVQEVRDKSTHLNIMAVSEIAPAALEGLEAQTSVILVGGGGMGEGVGRGV